MRVSDVAMQTGMKFAKMISISDFSKGKTSGIFKDVNENGSEYIVMKNNLPTGVVIPFSIYQNFKNDVKKTADNAKQEAYDKFMALAGIISDGMSVEEAREERLSKI